MILITAPLYFIVDYSSNPYELVKANYVFQLRITVAIEYADFPWDGRKPLKKYLLLQFQNVKSWIMGSTFFN